MFTTTGYFYFSLLHRLRNIKGKTESFSFFLLSACLLLLFSWYICEHKPAFWLFVNVFYKGLKLQFLDKSFIWYIMAVDWLEVLWQWVGWKYYGRRLLREMVRMVLTDWSNREVVIVELCHAGRANVGNAVTVIALVITSTDSSIRILPVLNILSKNVTKFLDLRKSYMYLFSWLRTVSVH